MQHIPATSTQHRPTYPMAHDFSVPYCSSHQIISISRACIAASSYPSRLCRGPEYDCLVSCPAHRVEIRLPDLLRFYR